MRASQCVVGVAVAAMMLSFASESGAETPLVQESDTAFWLELGVQYEPSRRFRLSLEQELRVDENVTQAQGVLNDLSFRYAPLRWLRFTLGYRFAVERDNQDEYRPRHRLNLDVSTRHRFRPLILGLRLRFQEEMRHDGDDGEPFRHTLRFRAGLQIRHVPVVDPYVQVEPYFRIADDEGDFYVRKLRGTVGVVFELPSAELDFGYRLEGDFIDQSLTHIVLVSWHMEIED